MKIYYSDTYHLHLPEGHRFPSIKYKLLKDYLLQENIVHHSEIFESPLASIDELVLAHDPLYIEQMRTGTVPHEHMKRVGFPWTESLYFRSLATVGGAIMAMKSALKDGISGNLAGGTHHAHADRGEGYCVFNDVAVASRLLHFEDPHQKIAIIDLDVHQGNGNSSILSHDKNIFILSIHGEKNYPYKKIPSHLDIGLPDKADDEMYLSALNSGMQEIKKFNPDYIFYLMGVDPLIYDKLGTLNVTHQGLIERDRIVLEYCYKEEIPVSLALGGGYADPIEQTVIAYANTYKMAKEIFRI